MKASCLTCGKHFDAKRSSKKYCSASCTQKAYLARKGFSTDNTLIDNKITLIERNYENPVEQLHDQYFPAVFEGISHYMDKNNQMALMQSTNPELKTKYNWVAERLKCILNQLLRLCYYPNVTAETWMALKEALSSTINNTNFSLIEPYFRQSRFMKQLLHEVQLLEQKARTQNAHKFTMLSKTKSRLLAIILDLNVPLRRFSDLYFK